LFRPGRRIAVYVAHDCEADPSAIVSLARRNGCKLYLPAIADYRRRRMEFRRYARATRLQPNRYGIAEPERGAARIAVRHLDLVLLPLVAVDANGTRLGTGAGFYDRCLQHLRAGRRWRRPKLIGLGYEFQRVAGLAARTWDVPLDALLTEKDLYALKGSP
jgi:5-formyltetrahydrofolate cyclo-ligase